MGILVVLTLVYKRHREVPKRPWKIWSLDISKQMLGQAFVHILNVLVSDSIAKNDKGNPCALYFLNIGVDTTVGELEDQDVEMDSPRRRCSDRRMGST